MPAEYDSGDYRRALERALQLAVFRRWCASAMRRALVVS